MARIANTNIPDDKHLYISLTYIYGIGTKKSMNICEITKLNPSTKVKDLTEDQLNKIREYIAQNEIVEGDLKRQRQNDVRRLLEINCYRGMRHKRRLPCRGQRTKRNARTLRGSKQTIANKKKESK